MFQGTSEEVIVPGIFQATRRVFRMQLSFFEFRPKHPSGKHNGNVLIRCHDVRADRGYNRRKYQRSRTLAEARIVAAILESLPVLSITEPKIIAVRISHTVVSIDDIPTPCQQVVETLVAGIRTKAVKQRNPEAFQEGHGPGQFRTVDKPQDGILLEDNGKHTSNKSPGQQRRQRRNSLGHHEQDDRWWNHKCHPMSNWPEQRIHERLKITSLGPNVPQAKNEEQDAGDYQSGMVVHNRWRICVNRSVPVMAGARLVVSDSGESLSPK